MRKQTILSKLSVFDFTVLFIFYLQDPKLLFLSNNISPYYYYRINIYSLQKIWKVYQSIEKKKTHNCTTHTFFKKFQYLFARHNILFQYNSSDIIQNKHFLINIFKSLLHLIQVSMPRITLQSLRTLYVLSLQSCQFLCDPIDCSPPGSFAHGYSPGKSTEVDCHALLQDSSQPRG